MSYEGTDYSEYHPQIEAIRASYPDARGLRGTDNPFKEGYAEPPKIDVGRSIQNLADLANLAVGGLVDDPALKIEPVSRAEQDNFRSIANRRYGDSAYYGEVPYPPKQSPKDAHDIYKNPDGYLAPYKYKAELLIGRNMVDKRELHIGSDSRPVTLSTDEPIRTHQMQGKQVGVYGEVFGRFDTIKDPLNDADPLIPIRAYARTESNLSAEQIANLKDRTDSGMRRLIDKGSGLIPSALRISYRKGDEAPAMRSNGVYIPVSPGLNNQNRPFKISQVNGVPEIRRLSAAELFQVEKDIRQMNAQQQNRTQG